VRRAAGRLAAPEARSAERAGGRLVTRLDPDYPQRLLQLSLPPPVLYVRGALDLGWEAAGRPAVAIVGSRAADRYGLEVANLFGRSLAGAGAVVVSGFARGVDAAAHRGALAGGGDTLAVLGCGLDVAYPWGHRKLGDEVAGHGALVTEFPCGVEPRGWHFPVRNRIIAALADAALVVQAAARSGSLITARLALELGREVFAVPGPIFEPRAMGPNALIADGATPALHPRDVLDAIPRRPAARPAGDEDGSGAAATVDGPDGPSDPLEPAEPPLPGLAGRLLAARPAGDGLGVEALAAAVDTTVDRALGALLELELGGWVRRRPGPLYARVGG
jgi:DNA processing protein